MARIPRYQIQRLQELEIRNPGVDRSSLEVGNSLLQNVGDLARSVSQANAEAGAANSNVLNAAIRGFHNHMYQQKVKQQEAKQVSRANAESLAAQAEADSNDAVKRVKKLGVAKPTLDMHEEFKRQDNDITDQYLIQHYRTPDGKPIDPFGESVFKLARQRNQTTNLERVNNDQDVRDKGVAASNFNATVASLRNAAAKSSGDPATLKSLIQSADSLNTSAPGQLSAAQQAFGTDADKQIRTLNHNMAKDAFESGITLNQDVSLSQSTTGLPGALMIEAKQLKTMADNLDLPVYKDHLTAEEIQHFDSKTSMMLNANKMAMESANSKSLVDQSMQASIAGAVGQQAARNGDPVTANAQLQKLQDTANQLAKSTPTSKLVSLYGHVIGQVHAIQGGIDYNIHQQKALAAEKRQDSMLFKQAVSAKQNEIYQSEDSTRRRNRLATALKLLPNLETNFGSPETYAAINEAREAAEDAALHGAIGFGNTASSKLSTYYGRINAALQKANQAQVNNKGGNDWLQKIQDSWSATGQLTSPAPAAVMNQLNPRGDAHLHSLINDQWHTMMILTANSKQTDPNTAKIPGALDASGNLSQAAINQISTKSINDFTAGFKQKFLPPVDAAGKLINAFMPPKKQLDVSGQVLKDFKNPPSPEIQAKESYKYGANGFEVPPPPAFYGSEMPQGIPNAPATTQTDYTMMAPTIQQTQQDQTVESSPPPDALPTVPQDNQQTIDDEQ